MLSLRTIDLLNIRDRVDSVDLSGFAMDTWKKGVVLVLPLAVHFMNGGHGFRQDESVGLSCPRLNPKLNCCLQQYFLCQFPVKLFGFSP